MTQFTQLNLNGKSEQKPAPQNSRPEPHRPMPSKPNGVNKNTHKPKTLTIVGSAVAMSLMGIALLETSGCSKAAKSTISAPVTQASSQPVTPPPVTAPEPQTKKLVKKAPRAKIPTATYSNTDYGVSFRYPKYDSLKQGDEAKVEWTGLGPVPMNFSQPGGTTISTVQLPDGLYPGTDFAGAFFNVSVAPKLTAEQCEQFASSPAAANSAERPAASSKVKIGKSEFTTMETLAGDAQQADAKYYHLFQNGNCYEFTLGMQTAGANGDETTTPVSRKQVFAKLHWILSTVKIKSPEAAEVAAGTNPKNSADNTAVKMIDDRQ